ncbi:hypothetical protein [Helicobacter sp. 12S02232-10]|nr:hypothetical protein [Helicobacter sp. 12S02232-10]
MNSNFSAIETDFSNIDTHQISITSIKIEKEYNYSILFRYGCL